MRHVDATRGMKVALGALLFGALGAPLFHVAEAIVAPQGFLNLRGDAFFAAPFVFLIAWLWSSVATLIVGGVAWVPLHKTRLDGFIAYLIVALLSAVGLAFFLSGQLPARDLLLMAAFNSFIVRLSELRLKAKWETKPYRTNDIGR